MSTNWTAGIEEFKIHSFDSRIFQTEILEPMFEPNRKIDAILLDHISTRQKTGIELLYSGGVDSEFVLQFCLKNKIPVEVKTIAFKSKGILINVNDIYYSEKYCREQNIRQTIYTLDPNDFFEGEVYLHYLEKYGITEPHIATLLWLIEQCTTYPVVGGDWPWIEMHRPEKLLSPFSYNSHCFDLFMKDNGINGIGNMLGHSFESCVYFIKKHIEHANNKNYDHYSSAYLKHKMYNETLEPRSKSYGWEGTSHMYFDITKYRYSLRKRFGQITNNIVWNDLVGNILNTSYRTNTDVR